MVSQIIPTLSTSSHAHRSQNFDTEADWNIVTEPSPGANGRQVKVSRGKFLGGSSGVNGTLCIRGTKQDYDDWNIPGWSGEEVFGYMKKVSRLSDGDLAWAYFNIGRKLPHQEMVQARWSLAWLQWITGQRTSWPCMLKLTSRSTPADKVKAPISDLVMESFQSQGLPLHPDMFSSGESPHGCGHVPRTVYKGDRTTAANYLLNKGSNLSIKTDTIVDKVILEGHGSDIRATGVKIIEKDGTARDIKAKKEVIVSGGAYCSPAILLRSGIGEKAQVAVHGIDCKVDLPGVGKNLMDHLVGCRLIPENWELTIPQIVFIFYSTTKPNITNDYLLYKPDALGEAYRQWKEEKRGPLSTFPFGAFAYARLDERLTSEPLWNSAPRREGRDPMGLTPSQPNIEFWNTECYGGPKQFTDYPDGEKSHAFSIIAELFAPKSRGSVTLKSADPKDNPVVNHNYLSDELDVLVLSEACRFGNEIITMGKGTKDIVEGSWPKTLTHHKSTKREDWVPYVKDNATTCKLSLQLPPFTTNRF
jgi:choline dehydrogenase-like flavoprotein